VLTAPEVRRIYELLADNQMTHEQIADELRCSRVLVTCINQGRYHKDLAPAGWKPVPPVSACGERNGFAKLSEEEVRLIYRMAWSGEYWLREIAERFNVSLSQIWLIKNRREWRHLSLDEPAEKGNRMPKIEIEQTELEQVKARVAELEKANAPAAPMPREPMERFDPTARASMDRETMHDLATAIPPDLARDLHNDLSRGNPLTQSQSQLPQDRGGGGVQIQRGDGWAKERKIEPPPGVPIMDRLMDMQDKIDKADLQRRLARSKE
jgi:hypothetical protein